MSNKPSPVTRKQVEEWIENPVTLAFKYVATVERDEVLAAKGLGAYHPFQPQRTQEVLANLNGAADTWDEVIAALEGEGLMDEQEDDGEARFE
jgi:hypothetical protein